MGSLVCLSLFAKAIAQAAAVAAASEVDSSEAYLTHEQKLKAERLKRAKMFATMIKGGAAPLKMEASRALSVEPLGSAPSASVVETTKFVGKEREGNFVPFNSTDKYEISEKEEDEEEKKEQKHSRKKHHSHRSSHKHGKRHTCKHNLSSDYKLGDKHRSSSDDNHGRSKSSHRQKSAKTEKQSKHEGPSGEERYNSQSKLKNHRSSNDESLHQRRILKQKRFHSLELEEGEINTKSKPSKASEIDTGSRESSISFPKSNHSGWAPSEPPKSEQCSPTISALGISCSVHPKSYPILPLIYNRRKWALKKGK